MILKVLPISDHEAQILAISIYCESSDIAGKSFGKRANVFPGNAPLQDIFQAEIEQTEEKKSVQQVDWNTQKVVDGNAAESGTQMRNRRMVVTGKLTDPPLWPR